MLHSVTTLSLSYSKLFDAWKSACAGERRADLQPASHGTVRLTRPSTDGAHAHSRSTHGGIAHEGGVCALRRKARNM